MDHHEDECRVGGESHSKQDDEEAVARLEETRKLMEAKLALRQTNLNPERPDAGFLRTLDSSIKRNTAVIKKLKQINEEQKEGLVEELRNVNLSKFVSEAVTAICDAKLKTSDIQAAVQVACNSQLKDVHLNGCHLNNVLLALSKSTSPGNEVEMLECSFPVKESNPEFQLLVFWLWLRVFHFSKCAYLFGFLHPLAPRDS
uniref:Regulator of nonsense transcripts n=1 Tax=Rhizophora mucronata TaxID=61149 RepID=A0A2P2L823_RHIMU